MGSHIVSFILSDHIFHSSLTLISLASTIFQMFVASDDASETFAGMKRIHGLMPYFMLKAALKITNPVSMIRSM